MSVSRDSLGDAQARLVASLTTSAERPAEFDAERLTATAAILADKRRRGVAKRFPALVRALGADFVPLFDEYARTTRAEDGDDDAFRFMGALAMKRVLPPELRALRRRLWVRLRLAKLLR